MIKSPYVLMEEESFLFQGQPKELVNTTIGGLMLIIEYDKITERHTVDIVSDYDDSVIETIFESYGDYLLTQEKLNIFADSCERKVRKIMFETIRGYNNEFNKVTLKALNIISDGCLRLWKYPRLHSAIISDLQKYLHINLPNYERIYDLSIILSHYRKTKLPTEIQHKCDQDVLKNELDFLYQRLE